MGKLFFWVIVILAALIAARLIGRANAQRQNPKVQPPVSPPSFGKGASSAPDTPESMVRCAHCGIHLPRSEALLLNNETWCSKEHAALGHR